ISEVSVGLCNGEMPISVPASGSISINPPITQNGYPNRLNCHWKIEFPDNCENSMHIEGYLRRGAMDRIDIIREGAPMDIIVPQDKQINKELLHLPSKVELTFKSDSESQQRAGYWKATLVAKNCREETNVIDEVKEGIEKGVNEIGEIIPPIGDIFHPKGAAANYSEGQTINERSHWYQMHGLKPGSNQTFKFGHPMRMYIVTKSVEYLRSIFIVSENRVSRENVFEAITLSKKQQSNGKAIPVFTGRIEYTVFNGNRFEDGSKSTFLYFVDERETNNDVYEVRSDSMEIRVDRRKSITLLSPESQIGITEVKLARHGGLKISAGGLREIWQPRNQLIRLTTYETANISSYSIFDPIVTIEPTNDENVTYTVNNLLYLAQVSMEPGAQGVIMSAGYPDFKIDHKKIDFSMRFKEQVYLDLYVQADTNKGSSISISSKSNHTQLSKTYSDMTVRESVKTDATEFRVVFEPSTVDSEHSDFLFATFWTKNG
ncbi:hypothetical protein PFISCL1PPCAC_24427, partial [Pristionchus fissidentatus]